MFPQVHPLTDLALLFLRIMLAIIFVQSGSGMLKDPAAQAKDLGYSRTFTVFLGAAEVLGGLAVALGILIQVAAAGLMVIGLGAVYARIFVWHQKFSISETWGYDLLMLTIEFVILTTGGGRYVLVG